MTKLRNTLTIGVVVVAAIGAAAGFFVVNKISPDAARSLLAVEAGVIVASAIIVQVMMGPTVKRIDELIEALRALARGEKHARVNAADFAGFADVARAVNEVAASLCENDDPNLGPVQKRQRERPPETHKVKKGRTDPPATPNRGDVVEPSDHPEVGAVRVRKKDPAATAATPPTTPVEPTPPTTNPLPRVKGPPEPEVSEPRPSKKATPTPPPEPTPPKEPTKEPAAAPAPAAAAVSSSAAAAEPDEDAKDHDDDDSGNDTVIEEAAEPQLPGHLELQALFAEFVKEKKAAGHEDVDVDFDAFQETILGECERLLSEHGCKGVRFEVAVSDGDVSLRPRLLR